MAVMGKREGAAREIRGKRQEVRDKRQGAAREAKGREGDVSGCTVAKAGGELSEQATAASH